MSEIYWKDGQMMFDAGLSADTIKNQGGMYYGVIPTFRQHDLWAMIIGFPLILLLWYYGYDELAMIIFATLWAGIFVDLYINNWEH